MPKPLHVQSWGAASAASVRGTPSIAISGATIGNGILLSIVTELKPTTTPLYTVSVVGAGAPERMLPDTTPPETFGGTYTTGASFTPTVNGNVTHIRYWHMPGHAGGTTHALSLWSSGGSHLTGMIDTEGAAGWREVALPTQYAVTSGTTYIVSMASTSYGFHNTAPPASLAPHLTAGADGRFFFGVDTFPATAQPANYYPVDVVFVPYVTGGGASEQMHANDTPGSAYGGTYTNGMSFTPTVNGDVTHIRYYHYGGHGGGVTHPLSLWSSGGTKLASVTDSEGGVGWRDVALATPYAVAAGSLYWVTSYQDPFHYYTTGPPASLAPSLTMGANSGSNVGVDVFPTSFYTTQHYPIDVTFVPASGGSAGVAVGWTQLGVTQPTEENWVYSGSDAAPAYDAAVNIWGAILAATSGTITVAVAEPVVWSIHASEWQNFAVAYSHGGGLARDYDRHKLTFASSSTFDAGQMDSFRVSAAQDNVLIYMADAEVPAASAILSHSMGTGLTTPPDSSPSSPGFVELAGGVQSGTAPSGAVPLRAHAWYTTMGKTTINSGNQTGLNYWPQAKSLLTLTAGAWVGSVIALKGGTAPDSVGTVTMAGTSSMSASGTTVAEYAGHVAHHPRVAVVTPGGSVYALPGAQDISWRDVFNGVGSGKFRLPLSDPGRQYISEGAIIRCYLGEVVVFAFYVESPAYTVASPDGEAGEFVDVQGRSVEVYLERAVAPDHPNISFSGSSPGTIMAYLINAAKTRGGLPLLTSSFTNAVDSTGTSWAHHSISMEVPVGTDLRTVLDRLRQMGHIGFVTHDLVLHLYMAYGVNRSGTVMLREGQHLREAVSWQAPQRQLANIIYAYSDTILLTYVISTTPWDRREVYVRGPDGSSVQALADIADAEYYRRLNAATSINVPMHHGLADGQYEPYTDFWPGDSIGLHVGTGFAPSTQRVVSISIQATADADYQVTLELSSVQPDPLMTVADTVAKLKTLSESS